MPLRAQIFALALCMLVLVAALHAIRIPQYIIQERERTQMVIYQQQAMQAYIDSYTQYENRLRTMRHDLKHMVGTVTELIENNDYEKAGELTRQVSEWMEASGRPEYSSDPLVNAIVSDYASRFSSAGIPLEVTIRLTSEISLSDLELTTVLHNILSNTWEYCSDPNREGPVWARLKITTNRNYFFLESMKAKSSGTLTLVVALDGESQGNSYQSTFGELKMKFAAEITPTRTVVKTGDETNTLPYFIGLGISGIALLWLAVDGRKRRKSKEDKKA